LVLQNDGEVFVEGHNTLGEMDTVHTLLGVCPQFETVWPQLTVEEHLDLFAELKGVGSSVRSGCVQAIAAAVKLDGDAFRQPASALSGGMKRRLSLGIALIADPSIVVADEPTTGLDPETRRGVLPQ
jgi:ABC-type multidrug transport system ATPase subunit